MSAPNTPHRTRWALLAGAGIGAALALAACGGSSAGGSPPSSTAGSSTAGSPAAAGAPGRGQFAPAASGLVAAISGRTMQVQNPQDGQVAVAWSAATTFSHQVTTSLASVRSGDCVLATAPSGTAQSASSFTAATLVVSAAVNGSCTGGRPGGADGGQPPTGAFPSGRPSGFPSGAGRPSGARGDFGAVVSGTVKSVSGRTVVVAARTFGGGASGAAGATPSASTTTRTITADASTKITTQASTTAASVAVGKCVVAEGKTDSSGTVAATSVRISDATGGQCVGVGRLGGGGGGG